MKRNNCEFRLIMLKHNGNRLMLTLGADNPPSLEKDSADEYARRVASRKGFKTPKGKGRIRTYGQNRLAERTYYYKR